MKTVGIEASGCEQLAKRHATCGLYIALQVHVLLQVASTYLVVDDGQDVLLEPLTAERLGRRSSIERKLVETSQNVVQNGARRRSRATLVPLHACRPFGTQ